MKFKIFLLATLLGIGVLSYSQGTQITINAPQLSGEQILIAYHYFGQMYVKDSLNLDKKGKGIFSSKDKYDEGLYAVCVNRVPVTDIILGNNQNLTIRIDTTNKYKKIVVDGSAESKDFNEYALYMRDLQQTSSKKSKEIEATTDSVKKEAIRAELRAMGASLTERQNALIAKYPNSMCGIFIKGLRSVEFKKPEGYDALSDSMKWVIQYNFQKNHYFDNIDLSDKRSFHTPYIRQTLDTYFDKILVQRFDSIIPPAINIIEKSRKGDENTFRTVCNYVLQWDVKSNIMGMDRLLVILGNKYYLSGVATWADSTLKSNIGKEIKKIEHSLVGDKAHNIKLCGLDGVYRPIKEFSGSKYTILFFFEPQCGHCKQTAPKISEFYKKYKDDPRINIIAIYMLTDKDEWTKFIEEKNMQDLINVWDPERTSYYWYWYDTSTTPMIYVLDKDLTIFAKKIDAETLDLIAQHELSK